MKRLTLLTLSSLLLAGCLVCAPSASAQEADIPAETTPSPTEKEWYYGPTGEKEERKSLGRQRAEQRARQRQARLETLRWYGIYSARPSSPGVPFTSAYNPTWTRPVGRRNVFLPARRPVVVVSPYYASFPR